MRACCCVYGASSDRIRVLRRLRTDLVPRGGLRMGFAQLVLSPGNGGSGDARGGEGKWEGVGGDLQTLGC